jgi:hypothetical protein
MYINLKWVNADSNQATDTMNEYLENAS